MTGQAPEEPGLLDRVLAGLELAEVRWALLRGRAYLGVPGGDMDVLVAADDLGPFEDVVFGVSGLALPRTLHPWHRFYVLDDPDSDASLILDVVTELTYSRALRIASGLETGCLDRRRKVDGLYVLDPTDMFWTVLLHCLLDKQSVTGRRRRELEEVVQVVTGPSPGEAFFASLCPADWSPERAIASVAHGDWDALADLRRQISSGVSPVPRSLAGSVLALPGRLVRRGARAIYPTVWRRAGLGVTPHILDVVESVGVGTIVVSLRRRPVLCEVVLLVPDDRRRALVERLPEEHYWCAQGVWTRAGQRGLERVRVLSPTELVLSSPAWADVLRFSTPMPGRAHCRRASAATSLLVTAVAVSEGLAGRGTTGQLRSASSGAWAEAERLAKAHGLLAPLEVLAERVTVT
jgi:hypothetical protein